MIYFRDWISLFDFLSVCYNQGMGQMLERLNARNLLARPYSSRERLFMRVGICMDRTADEDSILCAPLILRNPFGTSIHVCDCDVCYEKKTGTSCLFIHKGPQRVSEASALYRTCTLMLTKILLLNSAPECV